MRKGGCTANARPLFFEKELFYCKLTVASDIRKGLLLVSFGAVGSWSFAALNRGLQNLGTFQKDLILFVRICCFGALFRGLQNLESSLKGFNCCGAKLLSLCADLRFAKPRSFLQGDTSCHFLHRAKSNQKACSDAQKVAGGKFLCVGDRRNRENCERT